MNEIVKTLREEAKKHTGKTVLLPSEFVDILDEKRPEDAWKPVSVGKLLQYIADMLEE